MINSHPLVPPSHSYATGAQIPQPDGSFTLVADGNTGEVFSVQKGELVKAPVGSAGPNEKMRLSGTVVRIYASDGLTYYYDYDGVAD